MMLNWVDFIIILLVCYELYQGWKAGFVRLGISFIAFALSLWISIFYNVPVSHFFSEKFGIASTWSSVLSYVSISLVGQTIVTHILAFVLAKMPAKIEKSPINSVLGSIISGLNTLTTIAFVLLIILALPLKGTVQKDIRASAIGGKILSFVETYGGPIKSTADEIKNTASKFLTVSPGSNASMPLDIVTTPDELVVDDEKERALLSLVNKEREKAGASTLTVDVTIVAVARAHSKDMLLRRYFSHNTPDGKDLGNRLDAAGVHYSSAGENIAFAPDVESAHQGLMNSPDHKKNLLDPEFHHVGIGIIATTKYGIMVTQDFTN